MKYTFSNKGDFRSPQNIELLKQADIIITNPPFSLFREFISLMMKYDKKFLVIGNKNAVTYKEVFRYIKANKLWLGYYRPKEFIQPDGSEPKSVSGLTRWFTNLDVNKRHEKLILRQCYEGNEDEYP